MKLRVLAIVLLLFIFLKGHSESSVLILFTDQGERFTASLNGIRMNDQTINNLKITQVMPLNYSVKIIFENRYIQDLDFTITMEPSVERTYSIRKGGKGIYFVQLLSIVTLGNVYPNSSQLVVSYPSAPVYPPGTTITTTTTTTQTDPNPAFNFNLNLNTRDPYQDPGPDTYTTVTTTNTPPPPPAYSLPGYNGPIGCTFPMNDNDFSGVKNSIESKSFEDSKLTIAKQVINSNCLLTTQLKEIMLLFSFEGTRLDFAKYAYGYTYDIGNYYKLNDAFTFESSITDLNRFIKSKGSKY